MLMELMTEYNSADYQVSYDEKYDIVRLNNKVVDHFSYESIDNNILIMIEDETNEVIGAQVFDFIAQKESTLDSVEKLKYKNLKKALYKILEILECN